MFVELKQPQHRSGAALLPCESQLRLFVCCSSVYFLGVFPAYSFGVPFWDIVEMHKSHVNGVSHN